MNEEEKGTYINDTADFINDKMIAELRGRLPGRNGTSLMIVAYVEALSRVVAAHVVAAKVEGLHAEDLIDNILKAQKEDIWSKIRFILDNAR